MHDGTWHLLYKGISVVWIDLRQPSAVIVTEWLVMAALCSKYASKTRQPNNANDLFGPLVQNLCCENHIHEHPALDLKFGSSSHDPRAIRSTGRGSSYRPESYTRIISGNRSPELHRSRNHIQAQWLLGSHSLLLVSGKLKSK